MRTIEITVEDIYEAITLGLFIPPNFEELELLAEACQQLEGVRLPSESWTEVMEGLRCGFLPEEPSMGAAA